MKIRNYVIIFSVLLTILLVFILSDFNKSKKHVSLFETITFSSSDKTIEQHLRTNLTDVYNSKLITTHVMARQMFSKTAIFALKSPSNTFVYNQNSVNGAFKISLKDKSILPENIEIKFRWKDDNNYYLFQVKMNTPNEINLIKFHNGKRELLKNQQTVITGINFHNGDLYFYYFRQYLLLMYEDRIISFSDCLDENESGKSTLICSPKSTEYQMELQYSPLSPLMIIYLENDLRSLDILPDSSKHHWNKYYPENILEIRGKHYEFFQRVEVGDITKPSLLMPLKEKAVFNSKLGRNPKLRVSIAIVDKYILKSERIVFQIKVSCNGESDMILQENIENKVFVSENWKDIMLDMKAFSEKSVTISFESFISGKTLTFDDKVTTIWGNPKITDRKEKGQKNVILIILDAIRPDHLGCYGYKRTISPNIDNLAHEGVIFYSAITSAPWTLPSHMSIFTGLYPSECGYNPNVMNKTVISKNAFPRLKSELVTLAEFLSNSGYSTAAFTGGGMLKPEYNFDQGFDFFEHQNNDKNIKPQIASLTDWIKSNSDNKFFITFHTYETHCPYSHNFFPSSKNLTIVEKAINSYDSGILFADGYIGTIIDLIKDIGIYNDTLIIIMSDHGENFSAEEIGISEDNYCGSHGTTMYDSELKIPLIFSGGAIKIKKHFIFDQVRTIDIYPTIIEFLAFTSENPIQGRSILPLIEGKELPPVIAYSEGIRAIRKNIPNKYSIRTNKFKLISNINEVDLKKDQIEYEFYDLENDPAETTNLKNISSSIFNRYKELLYSIRKKLRNESTSINYESIKDLKNLGYIDK